MARLVAAFGCSHSPALASPPQDMAGHAQRDEQFAHHLDRDGTATTYAKLVKKYSSQVASEITSQKIGERVAACERHLARLAQAIAAARLDALVVVGDDQREQYLDDNLPAFLVYCGDTIRNCPLEPQAGAPEYWRRARSQYHEPAAPRDYPVARDLAVCMVKELMDKEFDVAYGNALPRPRGEGHAFGFVHRRLLKDQVIPMVPVVVNTYYPPNQPLPRRCYRFGQALRAAIECFPAGQRIGILASGGLSHFTIDEDLDRLVLASCKEGDEKALAAIPPAKLNSGSSEIRNWIVIAGAAERLKSAWQEYVPLYRTPAGTGCGMAFAAWQ